PRAVTVRQVLRNSHCGRAVAYDQLNMHKEAIEDWDKAIEFDAGPEQPNYRAARIVSRLKAGQKVDVVVEVEELMKAPSVSAGQLYDFACIYAVASSANSDQKQAFTDKAMELLRQAVGAG